MSVQAAHDFIKKAAADSEVLGKVRKAPHTLTDIAREHGHVFSKEDFDTAMRERQSASPDEDQPNFCWGIDTTP